MVTIELLPKLARAVWAAVYRATDTKLNRDIAIKILPDAFASDPERMARFAREAQLLASLNHPNIAAIYGIEEGAMVMELVDGANLAGPVPLETALDYARQQARIPPARIFGGGEVASADGLRFMVPVRTLNAGPTTSTSTPNAASPTTTSQ